MFQLMDLNVKKKLCQSSKKPAEVMALNGSCSGRVSPCGNNRVRSHCRRSVKYATEVMGAYNAAKKFSVQISPYICIWYANSMCNVLFP